LSIWLEIPALDHFFMVPLGSLVQVPCWPADRPKFDWKGSLKVERHANFTGFFL